ncbi:MAG: hypothetical protein A3D65_04925 [Candidatus Lloydbacteria bacterium RIFCSPHIGHO2_02_FULL_50_13]|uniref:PIN domain-containing protein n=1 Tax=Candidatus Lloydbacteria bacterium RIFCSPHIGHO2_02_FULL_50_13 TaxID=1798661 RepID=A0A1G2D4Q3_9BACT|nr:MAG: hypothetical protein A3D65_04925 [Candidatus Lloydbacteria bacterium RIFCSPHIGHO2_02_FULL_50_13]
MTLDSNIVIAYLAGDKAVVETLLRWKEGGKILFLPAIVESEVLSFPNMTTEERRCTEEFLDSLNFVAFDKTMARVSADIRRNVNIKFPDAAIAATALAVHSPLVTRNVRDFKKIIGLAIVAI